MSVYIPPNSKSSPWEVLLQVFQTAGAAEKKQFEHVQRAGNYKAGYIIGGWDEEGSLKWWDAGGKHDPWQEFGKRVSETPRIYTTLHGILKRIEWLQSISRLPAIARDMYSCKPVAHVGLVYWVHPEASDQPLEKYIRLSESAQFPGSPGK